MIQKKTHKFTISNFSFIYSDIIKLNLIIEELKCLNTI